MANIIWAVDAFQEKGSLHTNTIEALRELSRKLRAKVEPVYVLSPDQVNIDANLFPDWARAYGKAAEKALNSTVAAARLPLKGPKVLIEEQASMRAAIQRLIRYAKNSGAQFIVVGTQGRKGLSRFMLGSFAETLLLRSPIPVFVVNPLAKTSGALEHVLFPTDFSRPSRKAFEQSVVFAKALGAKMTIFHKTLLPLPVIPQDIYLNEFYEGQGRYDRKRAEAWVRWANDRGVDCTALVTEKGASVEAAILNLAKSRRCLIAMGSESGPVASTFLGSVARDVVRKASCPVWVLHG